MNKDNGGFAFPTTIVSDLQTALPGQSMEWPGMTLRDYFAIHCDQPGEAEIVAAAGKHLSAGQVIDNEVGVGKPFPAWYSHMTNEQRFALYAKVRYQIADAMLAERAK